MIEVQQQLSSVRRQVGSRVLPAGEARVVTVAQSYTAEVADLWDACTNPERLPRWFLPVTGDLRVGGRYQIQGNAGGTIERCDAPYAFDATWEYGGEVSWIEVRLSDLGGGRSELRIEHIAHVDDTRWAEFGPGAVGVGWDMMLLGMGLYLESGRAVDQGEVAAWLGSDQGRQALADSSSAWGAAAIAAGEEPALTAARVARTTAAYTGMPAGDATDG